MTSVLSSLLLLTSLVHMSLILLLKYDPKSFANSKSDVKSGRIGTLDPPSNRLAILKGLTKGNYFRQIVLLFVLRNSFVLSKHFSLQLNNALLGFCVSRPFQLFFSCALHDESQGSTTLCLVLS